MLYLLSATSSERTVPQRSSTVSSRRPFFLEDSLVVTGVDGGFETSSSLDDVETSSSARLLLGGRPAGLSLTGVLARELLPESEPPFTFLDFSTFFSLFVCFCLCHMCCQ